MIPDYPYYGFPNYINYINKKSNLNNAYIQNRTNSYKKTQKIDYNNTNIVSPPPPLFKEEKAPQTSKNQPMFSILGLNLYFDDILILVLIFFLFSEGSTDYFLIMILFLLLMN